MRPCYSANGGWLPANAEKQMISAILDFLALHSTSVPFARVLAALVVALSLQIADSASDGTPDFIRLDNQADQQAFRRWFTFLAEVQFFTPPAQRASEISDCSGLLRYAYREALRKHDSRWSAAAQLPLVPAIESVQKYSYPHTPLGPALFRVRPGPFVPSDLNDGAFAQFADAQTLQRFNTFFIGRDVGAAMPGDLLFYRREAEHLTYHSMIFVGRSQIDSNTQLYVVYHTGPDGTKAGEIRRLTLDQLLHYPDSGWRPIITNRYFLGVFRWNILKAAS